MGQPKHDVLLGSRTLLQWVQQGAERAGYEVGFINADDVARCGPLGGILTALNRSSGPYHCFLACDMPWVGTSLLHELERQMQEGVKGVFTEHAGKVGFPCILSVSSKPDLLELISMQVYSLQQFAMKIGAQRFSVPRQWEWKLTNINTPYDLVRASKRLDEGMESLDDNT